jgi:hypothetical protein
MLPTPSYSRFASLPPCDGIVLDVKTNHKPATFHKPPLPGSGSGISDRLCVRSLRIHNAIPISPSITCESIALSSYLNAQNKGFEALTNLWMSQLKLYAPFRTGYRYYLTHMLNLSEPIAPRTDLDQIFGDVHHPLLPVLELCREAGSTGRKAVSLSYAASIAMMFYLMVNERWMQYAPPIGTPYEESFPSHIFLVYYPRDFTMIPLADDDGDNDDDDDDDDEDGDDGDEDDDEEKDSDDENEEKTKKKRSRPSSKKKKNKKKSSKAKKRKNTTTEETNSKQDVIDWVQSAQTLPLAEFVYRVLARIRQRYGMYFTSGEVRGWVDNNLKKNSVLYLSSRKFSEVSISNIFTICRDLLNGLHPARAAVIAAAATTSSSSSSSSSSRKRVMTSGKTEATGPESGSMASGVFEMNYQEITNWYPQLPNFQYLRHRINRKMESDIAVPHLYSHIWFTPLHSLFTLPKPYLIQNDAPSQLISMLPSMIWSILFTLPNSDRSDFLTGINSFLRRVITVYPKLRQRAQELKKDKGLEDVTLPGLTHIDFVRLRYCFFEKSGILYYFPPWQCLHSHQPMDETDLRFLPPHKLAHLLQRGKSLSRAFLDSTLPLPPTSNRAGTMISHSPLRFRLNPRTGEPTTPVSYYVQHLISFVRRESAAHPFYAYCVFLLYQAAMTKEEDIYRNTADHLRLLNKPATHFHHILSISRHNHEVHMDQQLDRAYNTYPGDLRNIINRKIDSWNRSSALKLEEKDLVSPAVVSYLLQSLKISVPPVLAAISTDPVHPLASCSSSSPSSIEKDIDDEEQEEEEEEEEPREEPVAAIPVAYSTDDATISLAQALPTSVLDFLLDSLSATGPSSLRPIFANAHSVSPDIEAVQFMSPLKPQGTFNLLTLANLLCFTFQKAFFWPVAFHLCKRCPALRVHLPQSIPWHEAPVTAPPDENIQLLWESTQTVITKMLQKAAFRKSLLATRTEDLDDTQRQQVSTMLSFVSQTPSNTTATQHLRKLAKQDTSSSSSSSSNQIKSSEQPESLVKSEDYLRFTIEAMKRLWPSHLNEVYKWIVSDPQMAPRLKITTTTTTSSSSSSSTTTTNSVALVIYQILEKIAGKDPVRNSVIETSARKYAQAPEFKFLIEHFPHSSWFRNISDESPPSRSQPATISPSPVPVAVAAPITSSSSSTSSTTTTTTPLPSLVSLLSNYNIGSNTRK